MLITARVSLPVPITSACQHKTSALTAPLPISNKIENTSAIACAICVYNLCNVRPSISTSFNIQFVSWRTRTSPLPVVTSIHEQLFSVCITLYPKVNLGPRIVEHDCARGVARVVNDPGWLPAVCDDGARVRLAKSVYGWCCCWDWRW
jgi:hypothetical protein